MIDLDRSTPRNRDGSARRLGLGLTLALSLALPALAADAPRPGETEGGTETANWTVFLSSGSSIAATEVHYDKNQGRYTLKLQKGGYIHLSPDAVRRVSRDTADRVKDGGPTVATSTGSPTAGAVPGAIDTSANRPPQIRSASAAISPEAEGLKERAAARLRTSQATEGVNGRRPVGAGNQTPQRGMMERMIQRTNARPTPTRR